MTWTKTETGRRLVAAAKLARQASSVPRNFKVEVGTRWVDRHIVGRVPTTVDAFPDDDDLQDFVDWKDAANMDETREPGYIAHLYFTDPNPYGGGLLSVCTVWLGDDEHEPTLIHAA